MRKMLFIMFSLALTLSACRSGGAVTTINVTMIDFMFEPKEFTVPAGQEITVNAANNGAVAHQFTIFNLGTELGDKFGPEDEPNIYWKFDVGPGQSLSGTFTAPSDPGEYFITCGVSGHHEAGMNGKLIVVVDDRQ